MDFFSIGYLKINANGIVFEFLDLEVCFVCVCVCVKVQGNTELDGKGTPEDKERIYLQN